MSDAPTTTAAGVVPPAGTVTFLFTDIKDSTRLWEEHPVAMRDALARHDALVRAAVVEHRGYVVKTTGDGVLAAFGTAPDALTGAVAAQQALLAEPWGATGPLSVRMGLHTGEAQAREGDYYGQAPNRAARLMGLAHGGQVLLSRATEQLVRDALPERVTLVDVGEHRLRGLARPERVFQVAHPDLTATFPSRRSLDETLGALLADLSIPFPARLGIPTAFAGRDDTLERLEGCWADARGGTGRLALVGGEPGIGKTALVAELGARVHAGAGVVLYGRCDEEFGVSYEPFVEALGPLAVRLPDPVLGAHLDEYGPHLAHLVPSLRRYVRGVPKGGSDSDEERFQLFASIAALLAMVGKAAPVLLVIDDLHWADKPTISLLRHLVGRAEPMRLLVAATYRDSEVRAGHPVQDLLALPLAPGAERVTLRGLDDRELVTMLEQTAGHTLDETGISLADALRRDTGGNPFFVAELLRHLFETDTLYRDGEDRWQLRGTVATLGLPDSAREVIGHRVAHLGGGAQRVLSAAAVIGQEFELTVLARVVDEGDDTVLDELERSERAALVRNVAGDAFQFRHALVQHALYEGLGSARRSRLHLRVAETLETLDAADPHPEALAYHLAASGRPDALVRAVAFAQQAGDAALTALAPDQAVRHYREALRLITETAGSDERRLAVLVSLGQALRQAGDGSHRQVLLDSAWLADRLGATDQLVAAALANSRGWASESGHFDAERIAVLEAALAAIGPADSGARARLLAVLASELTFRVGLDRRRELSDEAVAISRRLGDLATLTSVFSSRFDAVRAPHLLPERVAAADENVAVARQLDDPMALWLAISGRTQLAVETADLDAMRDALEEEEQLADELRQPYPRWLTLVHQTVQAFLAGRLEKADRLGEEAFKLGQEIAQPDAFAIYAANLFSVWFAQGRVADLVPILEEACVANPGIVGLRSALASAYCVLDRRSDAQAILTAVREAGFGSLNLDGIWLSTLFIFAEVAAEVDDPDAAAELFELLEPFGDQVASDGAHVQGTVAQVLGRLAAVLGRDEAADQWFAAAEAIEGRVEAVLLQARTRAYWAEALARRDRVEDRARARELAEAARRAALEVGSPPVVARAERVLTAG
jgi:class 3 adenylate cyclase/tetratricopeptide (TPR) repeat protein